MAEFNRLDLNGDGTLTLEELISVLRLRCELPEGQRPPEHLIHGLRRWLRNDQCADFESFFLWSRQHAYSEEVVVTNPRDRMLRELARSLELCILDVEKVAEAFQSIDVDGKGSIDEAQFRELLIKLKDFQKRQVLNPRRCWREVNVAMMPEVRLEDVVFWYFYVCAT